MATFTNTTEPTVEKVEAKFDSACGDYYPMLHFSSGTKVFPAHLSFATEGACNLYLARNNFVGMESSRFGSEWYALHEPEAS